MKPEIKKLLILNLPYLLFVYLFDKVGAAIRLSPGADASGKLLQLGTGFAAAFSSIAPSFHPADLLIGIAGAVIVRLAVYFKGKNAKKYRKGIVENVSEKIKGENYVSVGTLLSNGEKGLSISYIPDNLTIYVSFEK